MPHELNYEFLCISKKAEIYELILGILKKLVGNTFPQFQKNNYFEIKCSFKICKIIPKEKIRKILIS